MTLLMIGLCGLIGIFSRYGADLYLSRFTGTFPFTTFAINLLGSFVAGLIYATGVEKQILSPEWRTALLVGFAGGFTTFSAYTLQTVVQWEQGYRGLATFYCLLSPVAGMGCALAGLSLGRLFFPST